MRELIDRLAQTSKARVEAAASSWTVRLPKRSDLVFEVVVPHDVLEWFISIRDPLGRELWSDWMDYAGYMPGAVEDMNALALDMERDIEWFVSTLVAAEDVRVTRDRLMLVWRRPSAEWRLGGRWQPVSMTDPRRSPAPLLATAGIGGPNDAIAPAWTCACAVCPVLVWRQGAA